MVDIHVHTKYSLLDSTIEPKQLVQRIKEQGKTALCVTEHGNLYSSIEIYKLCKENGIKYMHGCEMYICDNVLEKNKDNKYYHLVLISKNETGRLNLIKLVSQSNNYKYYGKPRIDFEMLKQHKDGIVVLSACMAGEVQRNLFNNRLDLAEKIALKYKQEFKDDYYLEFQSHNDPNQQILNRRIVDLANKLEIPYIVTTDAHYLTPEDQLYHNVFIQIGQAREVGETYNDCFVQTYNDIMRICKSTTPKENSTAINNAVLLSQKCNVDIPLSPPIMVHIKLPKGYSSEIEYLKKLCIDGWKDRKIHLKPKKIIKHYVERLAYEMNAIEKMGYEGYYLQVWDYCMVAKRRGIARGSGGGSLVAYLIHIVDTDPVKYGLYFERFIDVGALDLLEQGKITRSQLKIPDFDVDFGKEDRKKILQYLIKKNGADRIANLGSFQYIWAKGAIKDIGRVLNIPFEITNEITKNLSDETIDQAIELGLLDKYKDEYPKLFEYARKLSGLPKSFSSHPCGKLISEKIVNYYNATDINDDGEVILQGDMHTAEDLGLIKADFLGLRTVDLIYDILELIGKDYEYIAPHNINFEDELVFQNFRNGNTAGIFQFESDGMKGTLSQIECRSLYDLTVANALYRPGSIAFITNYANRRKGIENFTYLNDDLRPILKDSYGIIIFQEQLIEIGRLAGLSNPDELRKATAKKKIDLMNKIKPELFNGLSKRGWTQNQLNELWNTMISFAKYSFNKAHSLAYAMIAYICMYLKVYHPKEFICSWINSFQGKTEKLHECVEEAQRLGVEVYNAEFGKSREKVSIYKDGVMLGTQTIKYCNSQIAAELLNLSQNKYLDFIDLLIDIHVHTSVDSRQLKILTGLNFFKIFGKNKYLLEIIDIFDTFFLRKQIKKSDLEKLGISKYLMTKFARKETTALYKDIDTVSIIRYLVSKLDNKPMSVIENVKFDLEYLEFTSYVNSNVSDKFYIVIDFVTYKNKCKPYLKLRQIKTGKEISTKIKNEQLFVESPFAKFDIIKVEEFKKQYKTRNVGGEWKKTNELEDILTKWVVIK